VCVCACVCVCMCVCVHVYNVRERIRELRIACGARRLPQMGRKLELIDRLMQLKLRVRCSCAARQRLQ
jgi:hypothetical protein